MILLHWFIPRCTAQRSLQATTSVTLQRQWNRPRASAPELETGRGRSGWRRTPSPSPAFRIPLLHELYNRTRASENDQRTHGDASHKGQRSNSQDTRQSIFRVWHEFHPSISWVSPRYYTQSGLLVSRTTHSMPLTEWSATTLFILFSVASQITLLPETGNHTKQIFVHNWCEIHVGAWIDFQNLSEDHEHLMVMLFTSHDVN
jgi:hypothetical protein